MGRQSVVATRLVAAPFQTTPPEVFGPSPQGGAGGCVGCGLPHAEGCGNQPTFCGRDESRPYKCNVALAACPPVGVFDPPLLRGPRALPEAITDHPRARQCFALTGDMR